MCDDTRQSQFARNVNRILQPENCTLECSDITSVSSKSNYKEYFSNFPSSFRFLPRNFSVKDGIQSVNQFKGWYSAPSPYATYESCILIEIIACRYRLSLRRYIYGAVPFTFDISVNSQYQVTDYIINICCPLMHKFWSHFIVRRAGLLWSQQDFEWRWSVPLFKCLTALEFSFILFDLCLLITFFNFIMNYVPIVTFWIFTYHKIWILSIMSCFIWSYWIIYFLACLEVSWRVVS